MQAKLPCMKGRDVMSQGNSPDASGSSLPHRELHPFFVFCCEKVGTKRSTSSGMERWI